MRHRFTSLAGAGRLAVALPAAVPVLLLAQTARADDALSPGDTAWVMTSTALVLMMTVPGLALFYGGLVRAKNVLSILMQCMISAGLVGVLWVLFGYSLAFADGNAFIGGFGKLGLSGITPDTLRGTIPEYVFAMFQGMFAIITPALMIGAFAERMRFGPYLAFVSIWLVLVYCPLAHMVWGGGWLGQTGALDFAAHLLFPGFGLLENIFQPVNKIMTILAVNEYLTAFDAANDNVVQGAGRINTGLSGHDQKAVNLIFNSQVYMLRASPS